MKKNHKLSAVEYDFFQEFYEQHRKLIYYLVTQHDVKVDDIDDLVQDVVLRLMQYIPALIQISSSHTRVANYISQTVDSVYIDRIRHRKLKPLVVLPLEKVDIISKDITDDTGIPDYLAAQWDTEVLKEKLPQREWDMLSGKYIMGYSDKELATRAGCSQESIRMALTRARRNARKLLEPEGGENNE